MRSLLIQTNPKCVFRCICNSFLMFVQVFVFVVALEDSSPSGSRRAHSIPQSWAEFQGGAHQAPAWGSG